MRALIPPRLIAPLVACGIAGTAAVVGGACLSGTSPNPPTLQTGNYVLSGTTAGTAPGVITDSAGRKLRVVADTFAFNVTDQTYEERSTVAITLPGGTEQPAAPFIVSRRRYAMSTSTSIVLSTTLYGGMLTADIRPSAIDLRMPNLMFWVYSYR
jgi:hypothetical protein